MSPEGKRPLGVYVDLDSLLDTRLGTIVKHRPDIASQIVDNDQYYLRLIDDFPGIDREMFIQWYRDRDLDTLKLSRLTNVVMLLKDMVLDFQTSLIDHPVYHGMKIYVNIHPYVLNDDERDTLTKIIQGFTHDVAKIKIIDKPLKEVDCLWVFSHVQHVILYTYDEWLNLRAKELAHRGIPYVTLYCPMLYTDHLPTDEDMAAINELLGDGVEDHFTLAHEMFKPLIKLHFLPIDTFSYLNNIGDKYTVEKEVVTVPE